MLQQNANQVKDNRNKESAGVGRLNCTRGKGDAREGQALLELTLVTPMLLLLIVLAIDFGGWLYAWTEVGNATRAAANYAILGPSSAGSPVTPKATAITSMIATDLATLPNYSTTNPAVVVCWYDNGTSTSITGTCPAHSADTDDPEGSAYISVYVDLNYTYTPLIPSFTFPGFNIGLPSLPTSIHRHVVMRFI
jgi:Flp pilus assembly protein TadG